MQSRTDALILYIIIENYVDFFLCHNESGSFNCRRSIIKLSLLILLTKRIIEDSALFEAGVTFEPTEDIVGAVVRLEAVADVVLQLTPLSSLLIVLLDPEI